MDLRFWRLFSATGWTAVGDGMALVAFPLLALRFTHSPVAVAGVAVASRLPGIVVALPVGVIADRFDRRRLLVGIEALRFCTMFLFGVLLLSGAGSLLSIYAAAFLIEGLTVAFDVTMGATISSIVPAKDLVRANARLVAADMTGQELVGQALGGVGLSLGAAIPFLGNALSSAGSALLLTRLGDVGGREGAAESLLSDMWSGVRWFRRQPFLRLLLVAVAGLAFCQMLVVGVLAIYATSRLGLGSAGFGLFLAVASVGTLAGAVLARKINDFLGGVASMVLAGTVAAASYETMGITRNFWAAAAALAAESAAVMVGNVAVRAFRQSSVPQEMQGRAASAFSLLVTMVVPVGALLGGILAASVSIQRTFELAGLIQLVLVALLTGPLSYLRHRDRYSGHPQVVIDLASGQPQVPRGTRQESPAARH